MSLTPQGLIEVVAQHLQMTESRVKNYDRKLMEAGLRTKKGHGRGSAVMTMKDAAMLLIAIASTDEINDAATTAKHLWDFPLHESADPSPLLDAIEADASEIKKFGSTVCAMMNYLAGVTSDADLGVFKVTLVATIPVWARIILNKRKILEFDYRKKAYVAVVGGLQIERTVIGPALHAVAKRVAG